MIRKPSAGWWVARRAAELEDQAAAIEGGRGGDWRARQRRRATAAGLRSQAARFRAIVGRRAGELDDHLPF